MQPMPGSSHRGLGCGWRGREGDQQGWSGLTPLNPSRMSKPHRDPDAENKLTDNKAGKGGVGLAAPTSAEAVNSSRLVVTTLQVETH